MATPEVERTVRELIAKTLALDVEEAQPESRFFEDLGGESIDLLDLTFRVEKNWGVKMSFQQIADAQNILTDADGYFTPESLEALKRRAPHLNYAAVGDRLHKDRATELFTVSAIVNTVAAAIQEKESTRAHPAL